MRALPVLSVLTALSALSALSARCARCAVRSLLFASFLLALPTLPAQAQDLNLSANDTLQSVLAAQKGKRVTLRLSGGQEITGVMREASAKLVVLGGLAGREFFDAAVPLEKVEAVLVRTKQ